MGKGRNFLFVIVIYLFVLGCTRHEIHTQSEINLAPVEIKPIHITIDINVKIDRALDDFFDDLDEAEEETEAGDILDEESSEEEKGDVVEE
ncbi:MAG: hypothetical protein ACUZ77_09585 [Candidatus Brocadiales bacterium]